MVSWNLCGLSKLTRWPSVIEWIFNHDVILIQESLQTTQTFGFDDFTRFDFPAVVTGGRSCGGLVLALANKKFGSTSTSLLLHDEHMLAVEVTSASSSFIVINIYIPVHSHGFNVEFFETIKSQLDVLLENYSSPVIIAGN